VAAEGEEEGDGAVEVEVWSRLGGGDGNGGGRGGGTGGGAEGRAAAGPSAVAPGEAPGGGVARWPHHDRLSSKHIFAYHDRLL
jgi:hypothetical protein